MKKSFLGLLPLALSAGVVIAGMGVTAPAFAAGTSCTPTGSFSHCEYFSYFGAEESFTFPDGLRDSQSVQIEVWGAGGGGSWYGGTGGWRGSPGGGAGGYVKFTTSPGQIGRTIHLSVGEGGTVNTGQPAFGGGGPGGNSTYPGSAGGGFTGIFADASWVNPLVIMGGGGGTSPGSLPESAGGGGGSTGNGGQSISSDADKSGRAGTTTAGGAAATDVSGCPTNPTAGSSLQGGAGGSSGTVNTEGGGGGGGGYFGGGGGRCQGGGGGTQNGAGGGGSGFFDTTIGTIVADGVGGNGGLDVSNYGTGGQPVAISDIYAGAGVGGDAGSLNLQSAADGGDGLIVIQWEEPLGPIVPDETPALPNTGLNSELLVLAGLTTAAAGLGVVTLVRRRRLAD